MVSNSLTRRRHTIAAPPICRKPPPPLPPYVPLALCECNGGPWWDPDAKLISVSSRGWNSELAANDPLKVWYASQPSLAFNNPYTQPNGQAFWAYQGPVPPGTKFVAVAIAFHFSDGRACSAHGVVDTPGA